MTNLVFVCGALRSGSTLFHVILDHHPSINNPGEFDFLFDQVSDEGIFPDLDTYSEWLTAHRIFQSKSLNINSFSAYPELIHSFVAQRSDSSCVLALNIHRGFDRIPYLFPKAKFIHLVRDPRDVARSCIGMGWAGNVYHGVEQWLQSELSWKRLEAQLLPNQFFKVKFEDLILSPKTILNDLCIFIGTEYSDKMLSYAGNSTYSEPDPSLGQQWKTKLAVREIQYVESQTHELMQELGYELSGHKLISVGYQEEILLKIKNKIFKLRFSIKRYGFSLVLNERISRLFQLRVRNKNARILMNEINTRHLK